MEAWKRMLCLLGWLTMVPASAYAQASISGVVKDTSGAVLPGVTVEAASAVLIEKVRAPPSPTAPASSGSSTCGPAPTSSPSRSPDSAPSGGKASSSTGVATATVNAELASGHARGDDHRDGGIADRGRAERPTADDGQRRGAQRPSDGARLRRRHAAHSLAHDASQLHAGCARRPGDARHAGVRRPGRTRERGPPAGGRHRHRARRSTAAASRATSPTSPTRRRSPSRRRAVSAKPKSAARR